MSSEYYLWDGVDRTKPVEPFSSIRTLVEAFDHDHRGRLLDEFTPKQRLHLWFLSYLRKRGKLTETPANYWQRWEQPRSSLGSEWHWRS